jgi:hypothetical protein
VNREAIQTTVTGLVSTFKASARIVIVGASLAGLRAAEGLRDAGFSGQLTIIGDEPYEPYDRPPLSKQVLKGWVPANRTELPRLRAVDAEWRLGTAAAGLDRHNRQVRLANGDQVPFDRLLIATGVQYAKQPGQGMLSAMVNDRSDERMPPGEILSNALLLLVAGHETTVNLIAHSVLTLLRHPDVLEKLRRRPELIVPGVEEFLRFESSVQFWPTRTALEDIEIAGRPFRWARRSSSCTLRETATRIGSRIRTKSTSNARTTSTSATAAASTSVSAVLWRGWRLRSRWVSSFGGW